MSSCEKVLLDLPLYLYGDLTPVRQAQIEAHVALCSACGAELTELRALHEQLPNQPQLDPDDATMAMLRRSVMLSIKHRDAATLPAARGFFAFVHAAPAFQAGFALLLLAFGFLLGRVMTPAVDRESAPDYAALLAASRVVHGVNSSIDPFVAGIQRLKYDPATGSVEIEYNTINDISLTGTLADPAVRQILKHAMLEEASPTVRLHAVKALGGMIEGKEVFTDDLLDALTGLLKQEQSQGVRFQALRILRALPLTEPVKQVLLQVLAIDRDLAVRLEAFRILSEHPLSQTDMATLERTAETDSLDYIRYHLGKLRAASDASEPTARTTELKRGNDHEGPN